MELMNNWMGEGLLSEGIDEKLGEAKEVPEELKDASLLESIAYENREEVVKMHPIVWDMVIKLEKENPRFFIKPGRRIEKFAWEDLYQNVERVSLMSNNLKELPSLSNAFKFRRLSTLLLQGNLLDIQLDRDFFNTFPNLKTLDLSDTLVRLEPESLSCLKHLTVLLLRNCIHLTCLSSLSELLELIILDVSDCPIEELPSLSELKELMVLDVSGCPIGEFPHGINHLTKLVRLNLSRTQVRNFPSAWIKDVQKFRYLIALEVTFPSLHLYNSYTASSHWRQLRSFKFCVGGFYKGKLQNNSLAFIKEFPDDQNCLLENTSELQLMSFDNVTHLTIPKLSNLKVLDVSYCTSLRHLFPVSVIYNLENLEEIVVAHCENLVTLIEKDNRSTDFPSILVTLFNLPQLLFMYNGDVETWSMEEFGIWNCPQLQKFPTCLWVYDEQNLVDPPNLKAIRGDDSWLENLKRNSDPSVPFLEKTLIKEPPPEELTSRSEMVVATSEMATGS
ncbi:Disease resistance protein [Melia azedarach]|uniref:Disease resistance protein n=1 Tax=Melia azedarach TaxID=155640 RepID=A0ACC1Y4X9_MELAZ|nr:Disease resistance protein [Melia azedarach]